METIKKENTPIINPKREYYRVSVRFGGILKRKRTMQVHMLRIGETESMNLENLSDWTRKAREFVAVNARQVNSRLFLNFTKCTDQELDGVIFTSAYIGSADNMELCIDDISPIKSEARK